MDDFIILGNNKLELAQMETKIGDFLQNKLLLALHPKKTKVHPVRKGVDFLGYVLFEKYVRLRKSTVTRFEKKNKSIQEKMRERIDVLRRNNSFRQIVGGIRETRPFVDVTQACRRKTRSEFDKNIVRICTFIF